MLAHIEVREFDMETIRASEQKLLFHLFPLEKTISPPQPMLSEKKICVAAFIHTFTSFKGSSCKKLRWIFYLQR